MNFKSKIKTEDRAPITLWLGDSQAWMQTAVERDQTSGRGRSGVDHHVLNVAYVCVGLAFELVLKALAKSEGRPIKTKHESLQNYQALSEKSRDRVAEIVKTHTSCKVEVFLGYLDDRMCHPDRKYWMVGQKGEQGATGFDQNIEGLMIPDLEKVHTGITDMVGENTFKDWSTGTQVKVKRGKLIATGRFDKNGVLKFEAE